MAVSDLTTERSNLEVARGLADVTAFNSNGHYEEDAFRLSQQLEAAAPGASRIERLMALVAIAFDAEADRDTATICCYAAKDELHTLGHALGGIADSAAAFRSPPWEIVCAGLDLDPDTRAQDSRRALRHAMDADALAGLPLMLLAPAAAFAAGGDPDPQAA